MARGIEILAMFLTVFFLFLYAASTYWGWDFMLVLE